MAQSDRPSRVERRKQTTRPALLEVALNLFYQQNISWTSIEDITDHADIGKGPLFQDFPTKLFLLCTLLAEGLQKILEQIRHDVPISSSANGLHTAIKTEVECYLDNVKYFSLFQQILGGAAPPKGTLYRADP